MAQIPYRADLSEVRFPLSSQDMGRTVLVSSFKDSPTGERANTPEIYYCHNVMPTDRGVISVGYELLVSPPVGVDYNITFDDMRIIFGDLGGRVNLAITTDGNFFVLEEGDTVWRRLPPIAGVAGRLVTLGIVNGISYIYIQGIGCFNYNETTNAFSAPLVFIGLVGTIIGITSAYGYLIAYTSLAIAWSSTVNPLDFAPSAVTGAGGGNVSDLEGKIIFVVPNSLGLLVYTAANVVAATYTGNKQYPFKFKSVDNSKGAIGLDQVAYEANSSDHFAYTKAGLQTVNSRSAKVILPEVTDFLSSRQLEDFGEGTNVFTYTILTSTMKKKIKLIASRYLVISYGITEFTHALIYDLVLEKLGKIKSIHVDCFEYIASQVEISKESIAFLTKYGELRVLRFSPSYTDRSGVVILGKYQYVRDRLITLQKILVENVASTDILICNVLVSLDGLNTIFNETVNITVSTGFRTYVTRFVGKNHSIVIRGVFNLNTVELLFSVDGKR